MKYGLIGKKLSHSYSPQIHSFFGNDEYALLELAPEEVLDYLQKGDFSAINVTIPYKETVMPHCIVAEQAKTIGAVNTIVNRDGKLYGYNTDYFGFSLMAQRVGITFAGKKVLILGSGGTCKTATAVVGDAGAKEIIVVSRGGENNYDNIQKHYDADIIINTTPIGMYPNTGVAPIDLSEFTRLSGVIDAIYNPLKTNLILQAEKMSVPATGGLPMLVAQALVAHNYFFDVDEMDKLEGALHSAEKLFRNIVLIGMPGSGKTTMARLLAKKYKMKFCDSDDMIFAKTGKTSAQWITECGEPAFREIEADIIAEISAKTGQVVATGGGSILLEKNRNALAQNGTIIYLSRDINKLSKKGRPLSADIEGLYKVRKPIYEGMAEHIVVTTDSIAETFSMLEKYM